MEWGIWVCDEWVEVWERRDYDITMEWVYNVVSYTRKYNAYRFIKAKFNKVYKECISYHTVWYLKYTSNNNKVNNK